MGRRLFWNRLGCSSLATWIRSDLSGDRSTLGGDFNVEGRRLLGRVLLPSLLLGTWILSDLAGDGPPTGDFSTEGQGLCCVVLLPSLWSGNWTLFGLAGSGNTPLE